VGDYEYDPKRGVLNWHIPIIDDESHTGSMEFTVPQASNAAFFPVNVTFQAKKTFCALEIEQVTSGGDENAPAEYGLDTMLAVELYEIE